MLITCLIYIKSVLDASIPEMKAKKTQVSNKFPNFNVFFQISPSFICRGYPIISLITSHTFEFIPGLLWVTEQGKPAFLPGVSGISEAQAGSGGLPINTLS